MAYIGKQPVVGNFQKCDAISVVNGQAAYTLNVGGAAVTPENANHMLVSINGVLQAPGDSFTVSGSTLTFASNLATGDVIDFVIILGDVLDLGTPSDNSITTAKLASDAVTEAKIADDAVESEHLNNNIISGQTALAEAPADTDEFLVSDGGTIKRIDYSHIKGGGAYTKLLTTTISSATAAVEFNSTYITSTYNDYMIIVSDLKTSAESELRIQFSDDNGSSVKNDYDFILHGKDSGNNTYGARATSGGVAIDLTGTLRAESDANAFVELHLNGLSSTAQASHCTWISGYEDNSGAAESVIGNGYDPETTATNYVKLFMASGNIDIGKFTLYGRSV